LPNGAATFAFEPDFTSAYFSEGSGFIRDQYTPNEYFSLFANAWLKRQSVTQKTTFDPRVSALLRPTKRDVFRLSFGRSDGPPSPNLKQVGTVFAQDPGSSLTTVSCVAGGNTITSGGNPNLTSESANDFEAGYGHRFKDDSNFQATAYVTSVANELISGSEPLLQYGVNNVSFDATILSHYLLALQQQCGVPSGATFADIYRYLAIGDTFNIGHELARGLEINGRERINKLLYLDYGYSIESIQQSGISDSILANNATLINGGQIAGAPLHQGTISVDFAPGPWEFRIDNYYTEQNNPLNRPSYWYSNAFVSRSFNHGKTVLTLGGTNVFNQAAQYYGYIGQGTFTRYNPVFAAANGVNPANAVQEYVNGINSNEEFGLQPAQLTLTLTQRI
jgi:outer membrane receptor protein involved in Fe transport